MATSWHVRNETTIARRSLPPALRGANRSLVRLPARSIKSAPGFLPRSMIGKPVFTTWDTREAINAGYKSSSWVYACITKRMKAVASVPLKVQTEVSPGVWEDTDGTDELSRLIAKPNPKQTWNELTQTIVAHLDLGGNTVLKEVKVRGKAAELWALPPDQVKPVPNQVDFISHYDYNLDGVVKPIPAEDIIHFRYVDPANPFWGISPLMAGARVVDMEVAAVKWNFSAMQNRAVPDGIISFTQPITQDQFDDAENYLENQLMGAANNRRPIISGFGAKYERLSLSPAEMDFIESRKLTREEICGLFAVPPPLVGIYDKATLANIETARVIFWLDTIVPLLDDLAAVWNLLLVPEFGERVRVVYDTSKVQAMQSILKARVDTAKVLFDMGLPFNEINQRLDLGFDEVPGGEIGYLPATLEPTEGSFDDFGANNDTEPEPDNDDDSEE